MARNDIELWLILTDPKCARRYIADFKWNYPPEESPTRIDLDSGRTINFENMTDEDAVIAAQAILRDIEIPLVMNEKNLQFWEH